MENFGEQFCAYCGKKIGIGNKFCPYCGINVIKNSSKGTNLKNVPYKEIFFGLGGLIYLVILAMISITLWNSMKLVVPIILWINFGLLLMFLVISLTKLKIENKLFYTIFLIIFTALIFAFTIGSTSQVVRMEINYSQTLSDFEDNYESMMADTDEDYDYDDYDSYDSDTLDKMEKEINTMKKNNIGIHHKGIAEANKKYDKAYDKYMYE
ncbi:zinc-ribbon domain-containing protein [Limosilactobacillus sp. RRLNB_1_1]|uniref:Zinc-ribbon domain-containing protein n=1 Tax=Limosilactobacillus albertensis TaxID=2759752 RepID=A0A7W3TR36_9LACO|nr:zinc-ribbon domain-containing protein [Limosilactobacillus albertensis]MBB1069350.1 zinc-ribbon domain-containing protein [Limosilactobacillus albertensis]MCD7119046.1 zinc-ribbon domain-containing protein [Limosilactobacillus albertensis]MCD7128247.1 zinc-ribbon domain-containing protein [Limosilactobacillus albertensis]